MRSVLVASENFEMFRIFDVMPTNEIKASSAQVCYDRFYWLVSRRKWAVGCVTRHLRLLILLRNSAELRWALLVTQPPAAALKNVVKASKMALTRIYYFKMSDHLIDMDENSPHCIRRTSVPGYLEIGHFVVGINGKDVRKMEAKQFRLLFSKLPSNRCIFIDVLSKDSPPDLLDSTAEVSPWKIFISTQ